MDTRLKGIICCPKCHKGLIEEKGNLYCNRCNKTYRCERGIPYFIEPIKRQNVNLPILKRILKLFKAPRPTKMLYHIRTKQDPVHFHKKLKEFIDKFREKRVLDIGSGGRRLGSNVIAMDLAAENIDMAADAHALPFRNNAFDAIVIQAVLEHVENAEKVVQEAGRVLKNKGEIFAEIPFLCPVHNDPRDYRRYTPDGFKQLFKDFTILNVGISMGPSSAFSYSLRYYLAMLFSFNSDLLFEAAWNIVGWLTFWIKYIDNLGLIKNKRAEHMALSYFIHVRKK